MFENPRRGRQARNFTKNVPKILDLKLSSEQIFSENWRWVPLPDTLKPHTWYLRRHKFGVVWWFGFTRLTRKRYRDVLASTHTQTVPTMWFRRILNVAVAISSTIARPAYSLSHQVPVRLRFWQGSERTEDVLGAFISNKKIPQSD